MNDDATLAAEISHLQHRLNQALEAEIEYQQRGVDRDRDAVLAELEAVGRDIENILDERG